jgi:hypothetical protein
MNKILLKTVTLIGVATGVAIFVSVREEHAANKSIAAQVDSLIAIAAHDALSEKEAFASLVAMGERGVPFIIGHLGDMRPLPDPQISLATNNPNVNEATANYGAEVIHDALSIILQEITHQDIWSRYDGASLAERNIEREKIRRRWIDFCKTRYRKNVRYCEPSSR